jgi:hypothetical protein
MNTVLILTLYGVGIFFFGAFSTCEALSQAANFSFSSQMAQFGHCVLTDFRVRISTNALPWGFHYHVMKRWFAIIPEQIL